MADAASITTEGVAPLLRAFGKVDRGLRASLRKQLVAVAGLVAVEAKRIAEEKGLHDTGTLIRSIRPGLRGSYAYVQDSARRAGFNYPAVYEYGHGRDRAFLHPAADAKREEALLSFEKLLDRLAREAGFAEGSVL